MKPKRLITMISTKGKTPAEIHAELKKNEKKLRDAIEKEKEKDAN